MIYKNKDKQFKRISSDATKKHAYVKNKRDLFF